MNKKEINSSKYPRKGLRVNKKLVRATSIMKTITPKNLLAVWMITNPTLSSAPFKLKEKEILSKIMTKKNNCKINLLIRIKSKTKILN